MKEMTKNVTLTIAALCIAFVFIAIPANAKTLKTDIFSETVVASGATVNATNLIGIGDSTGSIGFQGQVHGAAAATIEMSLYGTDGSDSYPVGQQDDDHVILTGFSSDSGPDSVGKFYIPVSAIDIAPGNQLRVRLVETSATACSVTLKSYVEVK